MGVTKEERAVVEKALEEYPAGVPAEAWGLGRYAIPNSRGRFPVMTLEDASAFG